MKRISASILTILILFLISTSCSFATYDPLSSANNKLGIHILFPEEISEAATLINSSGGDWGYVTIPIRASEKNLEKWQKFMDDAARLHVIPILRIATEGDYFIQGSWSKPSKYDIIDFANFLNSLYWPTKNRYVIIYNEQNRSDEWGGQPNASEYAEILDYAVDAFKKRNDKFFVIMGGLDNASVDIYLKSVNQFTYMRQMEAAVPGIFEKIDGMATHSYPNPAFSSHPSYEATNSVWSFKFVMDYIESVTGKTLPIFITETGWSTNSIPQETQVEYYKQTFKDAWSDKNIVAVTPFIFQAQEGPFRQFSFIVDYQKSTLYNGFLSLTKIKGQPQTESLRKDINLQDLKQDTKKFELKILPDIFKINNQAKTFFKWLFNI